ncbi:MAG: hypothetical protein J5939_01905 [Bacteroidales bacterium]|nr:hypothetical protein [Bacteroidales bacterium]
MKKFSVLLVLLLLGAAGPWAREASACTSVIISGEFTASGRPIMLKHRDTDHLENDIRWFRGEKYGFIGLVNCDDPGKKEVWSGTNSAGFCIMNTATYDLKDDDVPAELMDREGEVMYRALEICETLEDFEHLLDTLSRPLGVEANFGVTDARGGAAYYEVNNWKWVKYDVNEEPSGYRVVTNFTWSGRVEDRKGVDRYEKACRILAETQIPIREWDHDFLINAISRSGAPILRDITAASIVFEDGVMWACLGRPDITPYEPFTEEGMRAE